jgi:hypothetical protein
MALRTGNSVYPISTKDTWQMWSVSRGCLLLQGTWSYFRFCRGSVLPYTRLCIFHFELRSRVTHCWIRYLIYVVVLTTQVEAKAFLCCSEIYNSKVNNVSNVIIIQNANINSSVGQHGPADKSKGKIRCQCHGGLSIPCWPVTPAVLSPFRYMGLPVVKVSMETKV